MKSLFPMVVGVWLAACAAFGQAPNTTPKPAATIPEVEAYRTPYLRNLATLRSARETKLVTIHKFYLTNLERLQTEITTKGDLDGALAVKAERERVAANADPNPAERKAMPAPLAALRKDYEKERDPIDAAIHAQEQEQTKAYFAALDALQKRFVALNQLDKALAVRTERERQGGEAGAPVVPATPPPLGATMAPPQTGAVHLERALAEKIAAVVQGHTYTQTESSQEAGGGQDIPPTGAVLVGFEFMGSKSEGVADIRSMRPYFLTREGIVPGKDRGELPKITDKVMARAGYGVAAIEVFSNPSRIQSIQLTFMKIDEHTGRFDTTQGSSYKSKLYGTRGRTKAKELGGDGRLVIGVYGKSGADADTIGLIQLP